MSVSLELCVDTGVDMSRFATRGIGLVIVRPNLDIWVQRDIGGRSQTGRRDGEASIPFETQKVGEPHRRNVLGALPEVFDDRTLPAAADHLYTTDNLVSTPRLLFDHAGRVIDYGLAVVVYDGPDVGFQPHVREEATPIGWMHPDALLDRDDVRPLARHAVSHLRAEGTLERTLAAFHNPVHPRELVVPDGFVVSEYHARREQQHDMQPEVAYALL